MSLKIEADFSPADDDGRKDFQAQQPSLDFDKNVVEVKFFRDAKQKSGNDSNDNTEEQEVIEFRILQGPHQRQTGLVSVLQVDADATARNGQTTGHIWSRDFRSVQDARAAISQLKYVEVAAPSA